MRVRNGTLACIAVEMALFGTFWHGLRGPLSRKAIAENGLGKTEKWAGTLGEKWENQDDYE
jgi:hypothetical protein